MQARSVFGQLESGALGATIKGINIRDLKRALIPVPPIEEQFAIASFVETGTARTERPLSGRIANVTNPLQSPLTAKESR